MSLATLDWDEQAATTDFPSAPDRWLRARYYDPGFKAAVIAEIDRIAMLPRGWDGYDGAQVSPAIIAAAKEFVTRLEDHLAFRPQVVPMSNGAVQFEWHDGNRTLELEFESPETIHFLRWHPEAGIRDENFMLSSDMQAAALMIKWFMRSDA